MNKLEFIKALKEHNISLTDFQLEMFNVYYQTLVEENSKYNLTSILEEEEVYEKHFYDSLSLLFNNDFKNKSIVDVGSGAGFPSLPLKIIDNELDITLLDANNKKIYFINYLTNKLNLKIKTIYNRAEKCEEKFDIVVTRSVASLNVLLEICSSLVKENGYLIAMKGSHYKEELLEASKAMKILGFELVKEETYALPSTYSLRCNLVFKKAKNHDAKYPREYNKIKKKPL